MIEILGGIGLTFIVTQSKLFGFVNKKYYLFSCLMCFGFWAGCLTSLHNIFHDFRDLNNYFNVLNNALAVSLISYILYLLVKPLMELYD